MISRHGRRKPYTDIGIRRLPCVRCGAKAKAQWQICSDGNVYRPLCANCDILLNTLVLEFVRDPEIDVKLESYKQNFGIS
jgi:hypothetical protein